MGDIASVVDTSINPRGVNGLPRLTNPDNFTAEQVPFIRETWQMLYRAITTTHSARKTKFLL